MKMQFYIFCINIEYITRKVYFDYITDYFDYIVDYITRKVYFVSN